MKSKTAERVAKKDPRRAIIERLVAERELSELEASWLLKAWELAGTSKTRDPFGCYIAGFLAGLAIRTVKQELKTGRN